MKTSFSILALALLSVSALPLHADSVESEEAFDRAAGLFERSWKPTPKVEPVRFPTPTPPQVQPVPPPWSQQPQGSQTPPPEPT